MTSWLPDSAVVVVRRVVGENEPRNAYRNPYWKQRNQGLDRSRTVRKIQMHPPMGLPPPALRFRCPGTVAEHGVITVDVVGLDEAVPIHRVLWLHSNYFAASTEARTHSSWPLSVKGGADDRFARGLVYDGHAGGLVVANNDQQPTYLWLVDTSASTMTKWDPLATNRESSNTASVSPPVNAPQLLP